MKTSYEYVKKWRAVHPEKYKEINKKSQADYYKKNRAACYAAVKKYLAKRRLYNDAFMDLAKINISDEISS